MNTKTAAFKHGCLLELVTLSDSLALHVTVVVQEVLSHKRLIREARLRYRLS